MNAFLTKYCKCSLIYDTKMLHTSSRNLSFKVECKDWRTKGPTATTVGGRNLLPNVKRPHEDRAIMYSDPSRPDSESQLIDFLQKFLQQAR